MVLRRCIYAQKRSLFHQEDQALEFSIRDTIKNIRFTCHRWHASYNVTLKNDFMIHWFAAARMVVKLLLSMTNTDSKRSSCNILGNEIIFIKTRYVDLVLKCRPDLQWRCWLAVVLHPGRLFSGCRRYLSSLACSSPRLWPSWSILVPRRILVEVGTWLSPVKSNHASRRASRFYVETPSAFSAVQ